MPIARKVQFTAPRQVEVAEFDLPEPAAGQVQVQTIASGISAGTEMNVYRGIAPQWRTRRDPASGLFVEGESADWSYPITYGYLAVGRVIALGEGVAGFAEGDLVMTPTPHQSHVNVPITHATRLGELADPRLGLLAPNLNTALSGILDARITFGDVVVVSGLGTIGQVVAQIVRRSGASRLVAIDRSPTRRELAKSLAGADEVFDPSEPIAERVRELSGNRGADVVIEVSGAPVALGTAIRTVGYNGRVVALSWYGSPINGLDLSTEFHHNRVQVISSQTATVNPALGPLWTFGRRAELAVSLLSTLDLAPLLTHEFPVEQAAEAYACVDELREGLVQCLITY